MSHETGTSNREHGASIAGTGAIGLFGFADLVAGTGLHTADVEEVGTVDDELLGLLEEVVESVVATLVEERVGRAVQDPHHEDREVMS